MRVDELDISDDIAVALDKAGFVVLHPPQAEAIPIALRGRNLVAAIPTASGKSLIGYIPALKTVLTDHKKVLYIVPLKALAAEKKDDFDMFSYLGIRTHLSTGDLDSEDRGIEDADIVVATSEKADSMIRHGSRWIDRVGLIIADEIHMIHDPGRGPTLEVALTKLMRRNPDVQIIALSATVSNPIDLADWLDADLVRSEWRPIPLREGVYMDGEITFDDRTKVEVPVDGEDVWSLIKQTILMGGQCLVFVNSRRSTEALAVRYSPYMKRIGAPAIAEEDLAVLEQESESTSMAKKLASCIRNGMAFHNAGLTMRQRKFVERGFKRGNIKCIVATPTLAAGINLPARRVIIRDTTRFENGLNAPISVMEVKQMCGRAGRPGYDPYGEAILVAKNIKDQDHLMEDYIDHDTERLTSKLFSDRVLRGHILGLIATGDADSEESIIEFLKGTFYGATSSLFGVESVVSSVVSFLEREEMVEVDGERIRALPFGKRVSDLCIDPESASILRKAVLGIGRDTDPMLLLIAAAMTPDVMGSYPKKADEARIASVISDYEEDFLVDPDELDDYDYEFFSSDVKSAIMVKDWIEETDEETMTDALGVGPGDIRAKIDMMDWIIYSMNEIALIFNPDASRVVKPLMVRIRYGVKEELSALVAFRGVGRSRARILFNKGLRDRSDIASASESEIAAIQGIGPALAHSLKEQAGCGSQVHQDDSRGSPSEEEEAMLDAMALEYGGALAQEPAAENGDKKEVKGAEGAGPRQSSLFDFRSSSLGQDALDVGDVVAALYGRGAVVDDGVGVLQAVAGADAHHALVPVDDPLLAELPEPGDGCRGCGLDADALPPSEELLRGDDLLVGDGGAVAAGGVHGMERLPPADGVSDPDGGGNGLRVLLGDEVLLVGPEGPGDGGGALGLYAGEHGDLVDPADLLELGDGLVDGPDVRGVPHGQDDPVGDVVLELVHDLEEHGLLPLGAVWVDGVEQVQLPLVGHLPGQGEGVVEVPVDGQDLGAEEKGLRQLAHGDLAGGQEHGALHAGLGGVGRQGCGGVARGCASDDLGSQLLGVGDTHGHPPVLEGAGGVQPLELHEGVRDADLGAEGPDGVQRGAALLDGHLVGGVHGHEGRVPPDPQRGLAEVLGLHLLDLLEFHLDGQETAASGAGVDERVGNVSAAIPAHYLVLCHFKSSCSRIRIP